MKRLAATGRNLGASKRKRRYFLHDPELFKAFPNFSSHPIEHFRKKSENVEIILTRLLIKLLAIDEMGDLSKLP